MCIRANSDLTSALVSLSENLNLLEKKLSIKQVPFSIEKFLNNHIVKSSTRIFAGIHGYQVKVINQSTGASCGYEALKNGLILFRAVDENKNGISRAINERRNRSRFDWN